MLHKELLDAQRDIELRSTAEGYARFTKANSSALKHEGPYATVEATKVISGSISIVSKEITAWLEKAIRAGGRGKSPMALSVLRTFDTDTLAFITLNAVFAGVTKQLSAAAVQAHIGTTVETEVIARDLEAIREGKVADRVGKVLSRQGSSRNRAKVFSKMTKEHLDSHEDWPQDKKVKIGEPLVNALLLSMSEVFELATVTKGRNNRQTIIRLTEEGVALIASLHKSVAWMNPIHRPMVVKPRPWVAYHTGCYYDLSNSRNVKLVRTFNKDHATLIKQAIASGQMEFVMEALNAIQDTPWAINTQVLEVLTWAYENDIVIAGMPTKAVPALPPRLDKDQWEAMSDFDKKKRKINLAGLREKGRGVAADMMVMQRDLETAQELSDYGRFYLPHNLDFRGRVYPVPHFSHQRADHIKGVFRFADGSPLRDLGASWLSVHLANCGDFAKVSKQSFDARVQWVSDNEAAILSYASDPKATVTQWGQADKPFQFLAACFEYSAWVNGGRSPDFLSHLPVALDGSNSGLQHYSAAMRAEDEAALVSLLPCDAPADLYQTVADRVYAEAQADTDNPLAALCLPHITRKLVKRNVMTFAYSSAQFGFRQQLMSDTMRPLNDDVLTGQLGANPFGVARKDEDGNDTEEMDGGFAASGYLAQRIYRTVTSVVTKATEGMAFFKGVASALAHEAKPLVWVSPVGLPIIHQYNIWDTKAVKLFLYDRSVPILEAGAVDKLDDEGRGVIRQVRANIRTKPLDRIDKEKARSAVAPNVIHSMDAAHLMLTVLAAKREGITNIALIHDSFGTYAGDTQRFSQIIREAFVDMYSNYDPFEEVLESAMANLTPDGQKRLPPMPTKGSLDLEDVLDAAYAFA